MYLFLLNLQNSQQKAWKSHPTYIPSSLIHEMCRGNFSVYSVNSNQAADYSQPLLEDI